MKRTLLFLILFLPINASSTLFSQSKENAGASVIQLEPGKHVQKEMSADEIHKYRVHLKAN